MSAKKSEFEPSQTDISVLYGLFRATVQHKRILVGLQEIYPFCKQDERNVRWTIARLKNRPGLVSSQRVPGCGIMWVWCGKKKLRPYLLGILEKWVALGARDNPKRMVPVREMLKNVKKFDKEPRARTVHAPAED